MELSPLLSAAKNGKLEQIKKSLNGGADIDETSKNGSTALILAAEQNQLELVKYLVKQGADPNMSTSMGATALNRAAEMVTLKWLSFCFRTVQRLESWYWSWQLAKDT